MAQAVRSGIFRRYSGLSEANFKERRLKGFLPFSTVIAGRHCYIGSEEFLAWALQQQLIAARMNLSSSSEAVRESGAAERFVDQLGRGQEVGDLHLVVVCEVLLTETRDQMRMRAYTLSSAEVSDLKAKVAGVTEDERGGASVSSVMAVRIAPVWRAAVERAEAAGITLRPGYVGLADDCEAAAA